MARPDSHLVWHSAWQAGSPEEQLAEAEQVLAAWEPWPPGLLSHHVLLGFDGTSVAHVVQWADPAAARAYAAVPGLERRNLVEYELYRGDTLDAGDAGDTVPGCIVLVNVTFDGPDADRQRRWIDAVFEALASEPHPAPGAIAGYFHASTDGTRVLNYAQWVSEQAHRDALAAPGDGIGSPTPEWERVQNFPGLATSSVVRYRVYATRTAP